jgi:muramoyltetrapeptide carboxypeptidase
MNRKHFLQTIIPAAAVAALHNKANAGNRIVQTIPQLQNLQAGDVIGITCPASPVNENRLLSCMKALNKWGLNVQLGETVGKQWQRFGGTDEERLADFQRMLDDDNIKAILFAKGGYGMMRIIDKVNWDKFVKNPKWLIGFSDLTTIHLHVHANFELPTIHGDMATGLGDDMKDISSTSLHDVLFGNRIEYTVAGHSMNREGYASGKLVGGNLSLLQACAASRSDIKTEGKILFIEDVSEYKYTIDRMMMNVKRSGKLSNLAGLVVGMFSATKKEVEDSFTEEIENIIMDKVAEYKYPVCFAFPAGHIKNNYALKMGVNYDLNISKKSVTLFERFLPDMAAPTAPKMMMQETLIKVETIEDL